MLENIIISLILMLCALLIGRKYYKQWRTAFDSKNSTSCGSSCCGCSVSDCSEKE